MKFDEYYMGIAMAVRNEQIVWEEKSVRSL